MAKQTVPALQCLDDNALDPACNSRPRTLVLMSMLPNSWEIAEAAGLGPVRHGACPTIPG
eukprot:1145852-Pelagomonas_calceolata.AAC.6